MTKVIERFAPAKINLYLDVTGKRPDGYHDIESVMQTVTLFDKLTFRKLDADGEKHIHLTCSDKALPIDGRNLVYRAAEKLFSYVGLDSYNSEIELEKRIPSSAGLGGGSSDAACTLLAVNELYGLNIGVKELCRIGASLGADVPFCIIGGTAVTLGIGDVLEPCPTMPSCYILVACGGEGVSTPWAYKRLDEMYDFTRRSSGIENFTAVLEQGNIKSIAEHMINIFENAVLPERETARQIRDILNRCGAVRAMMSGSGPSIVGIYTHKEKVEEALRELTSKGIAAHICMPYYPGHE